MMATMRVVMPEEMPRLARTPERMRSAQRSRVLPREGRDGHAHALNRQEDEGVDPDVDAPRCRQQMPR